MFLEVWGFGLLYLRRMLGRKEEVDGILGIINRVYYVTSKYYGNFQLCDLKATGVDRAETLGPFGLVIKKGEKKSGKQG